MRRNRPALPEQIAQASNLWAPAPKTLATSCFKTPSRTSSPTRWSTMLTIPCVISRSRRRWIWRWRIRCLEIRFLIQERDLISSTLEIRPIGEHKLRSIVSRLSKIKVQTCCWIMRSSQVCREVSSPSRGPPISSTVICRQSSTQRILTRLQMYWQRNSWI